MQKDISHKDLIDIENIPKEDYPFYLNFFSEGSDELYLCLKVLWDNHLYTLASCKGHDLDEPLYLEQEGKKKFFILLYAYIAMKPNNGLFEYLSADLINDPYVQLRRDTDNEAIYIYGHDRFKKLNILARDVLSGKKDNKTILDCKINRSPSRDTMRRVYREYYYDNDFYFEEIRRMEELDNKISFAYLNGNDTTIFGDECSEIIRGVYERNISKKESSKQIIKEF